MSPRRTLGKKFLKSFLPIVLLLLLAVIVPAAFIVYGVTRPPRHPYLVTKENFSRISGRASKVSDERWNNLDGTQARGWLLKGVEGSPAVILLHRYGTDRSWLFNLGIKINETTNFTILWPDLRGHGMDPPVSWTGMGILEGDDVLAAIQFLRTLKDDRGKNLVGAHIGAYGVELGAYAALKAAQQSSEITALVLDSVPRSVDDLLHAAVRTDLGLDNHQIQYLARLATHLYFLGKYDNATACETAASLQNRHVLLLSGPDADYLRESTVLLTRCFRPSVNLEVKVDLPLTGFNLPSATGEQGEVYDRGVIEFFDRALR